MKTGNIIGIVLIILLVGAIFFIKTNKTGSVVNGKEDIFRGVITNLKLEPQKLSGVGVYDRSCIAVENGLTNCDGGIQTEKGLLNFNYKHNMHAQKCIDAGQKLEVEILDSSGNAIVKRIS